MGVKYIFDSIIWEWGKCEGRVADCVGHNSRGKHAVAAPVAAPVAAATRWRRK